MKVDLTHRETQIMELLCEGKTNNQIALDLKIFPKTVELYQTKRYRKLGCTIGHQQLPYIVMRKGGKVKGNSYIVNSSGSFKIETDEMDAD